jgi:hypothetical protein
MTEFEHLSLFDGTPALPVERIVDPYAGLSADARRTGKQRQAVALGMHPLTKTKTRPDLGTCGSCALRSLGRFPKCTLGADLPNRKAGPYMTRGAATDCRAWWPACDNHQPKEPTRG